MSGGSGTAVPTISRDLTLLAPQFAQAAAAAIKECNDQGIDAFIYEAFRSNELQAIYYARGRTVIPPKKKVTNAKTNLYSWHGYGLAVDVISKSKLWTPAEGEAWFKKVAGIFKKHDCKWGGDWTDPDTPHFQWARCKPSPSDLARLLIAQDGPEGVWKAVGAE